MLSPGQDCLVARFVSRGGVTTQQAVEIDQRIETAGESERQVAEQHVVHRPRTAGADYQPLHWWPRESRIVLILGRDLLVLGQEEHADVGRVEGPQAQGRTVSQPRNSRHRWPWPLTARRRSPTTGPQRSGCPRTRVARRATVQLPVPTYRPQSLVTQAPPGPGSTRSRRQMPDHCGPEPKLKIDSSAGALRFSPPRDSYRSTSTGTPRICSWAFRNSISDHVPTRPSWLSSPTNSRARDNEAAATSRKTFKAGTRLGTEPTSRSLADPCAARRATRTSSGAGPGPACSHRYVPQDPQENSESHHNSSRRMNWFTCRTAMLPHSQGDAMFAV